MRQHPDPDPDDYEDEDDLEELGTPVYQGTGLSVRALTAEELQRFLDAHADQPAELLGSSWATLDLPGHPGGVPWTPPAPTLPVIPAKVTGSLGSPGRSALVEYRRRRLLELAAWTRSLAWRSRRWSAGGCGSAPRRLLVPSSAAPKGSATPPASWTGSRATATWFSTTWPCQTRPPTSITW